MYPNMVANPLCARMVDIVKQTPIPRSRDPSAPKDLQLKFRLSRELHDGIEDAAKRAGLSISQEIRRRLEVPVADDPETGQLVEAIKLVAGLASWRRSPRAFATFKMAVNALINEFRPHGKAAALDAAIQADGYKLAGVALGTLGLSFQVGLSEAAGAEAVAQVLARVEGEKP
jgi:hypothetical protein